MKTNVIWIYLLTSIFGVISIVLPTFFLPDLKQYDSPLFPIIRTGFEGISIWSFGLLLLSGFGVKLLSKLSGWKIGLATMAFFPILAIIEMIVDSSSHNLLPFEFIGYALYSVPGIIGAYLAQGTNKILGRREAKQKIQEEKQHTFVFIGFNVGIIHRSKSVEAELCHYFG